MYKILIVFLVLTILAIDPVGAQVVIGAATNPQAALEIKSDTSGILIPKYATLSAANTQCLPKLNANHLGLMIYVVEQANAGFWFYTGVSFSRVGYNGSESLFKVSPLNSNQIIYSDPGNYGKDFLVNADSVNYNAGTESKMMFLASKKAFRAGAVSSTGWNNENIGAYSNAIGLNTMATASYSGAMGNDNIASGTAAFSLGDANVSSGAAAMSMGNANRALGNYSVAIGQSDSAMGINAVAIGLSNNASGSSATAIGKRNHASGESASAIGVDNMSTGLHSVTIGTSNISSGDHAISSGFATNAPSAREIVMGAYNSNYVPASTVTYNPNDRAFVVGTGQGENNRNDGLIIYKDGTVELDSLGNVNLPLVTNNRLYALNDSLYYHGTNLMRNSGTNTTDTGYTFSEPLNNTDGTISLLWNGAYAESDTGYIPRTDLGAVTMHRLKTYLSAGAGINFNRLSGIITSKDTSETNEIQSLSLSGNDLVLSKGGGTITLPLFNGNNDTSSVIYSQTDSVQTSTGFRIGGADAFAEITSNVDAEAGTNGGLVVKSIGGSNKGVFLSLDARDNSSGRLFGLNSKGDSSASGGGKLSLFTKTAGVAQSLFEMDATGNIQLLGYAHTQGSKNLTVNESGEVKATVSPAIPVLNLVQRAAMGVPPVGTLIISSDNSNALQVFNGTLWLQINTTVAP